LNTPATATPQRVDSTGRPPTRRAATAWRRSPGARRGQGRSGRGCGRAGPAAARDPAQGRHRDDPHRPPRHRRRGDAERRARRPAALSQDREEHDGVFM